MFPDSSLSKAANGQSYPRALLRTSFRGDGKVKHRTTHPRAQTSTAQRRLDKCLRKLDGCDVLRTDLTKTQASKDTVQEGLERLNTYCAVEIAGMIQVIRQPRADMPSLLNASRAKLPSLLPRTTAKGATKRNFPKAVQPAQNKGA